MANEIENNLVSGHTITTSPTNLPIYTDEKSSPALSVDAKDMNPNEKDLGLEATNSSQEGDSQNEVSRSRHFWIKYRIFFHLAIWLVMTGWWIAGLVLHRYDIGWLKPFLLWLAITIRLVTFHVSTKYVTNPIAFIWVTAVKKPAEVIPEKLRLPLGAAGTVAVIIVGTFASEESADNTRANRAVSLFGLLVFIGSFYITSRNRKLVNWQAVIVGMLAQFILALFVLRTEAGYDIFNFIAYLASTLLGFAAQGTLFLTGQAALDTHWFIVGVIPPIIFFVAFVQLLYYWGVLQWGIKKFATIFFYTMGVSGAEAVVAAASPFVGQGESAMLIKPFIPHLTDAELHQIMTSGFATIAGSVLSAYIAMGISPLALVSSCVMSIPASLAISKLRWPETEESLTAGKIIIPKDQDERASNSIHAFANGSWLGIKIAGMIIAGLLCILALLGLVNGLLGWWGHYLNIPNLTVELILGYIFYPVAFLLGVERNGDLLKVAELIGVKIVANEFFSNLSTLPAYAELSSRSRLIATYAVCGFGNISSVGIQIGVLSQLAPGRSGRIAKVALSALVSGVISTLTSASIAGMLVSDQAAYTAVAAA
ncbi:hypothetical protein G7Y89_g6530 [Cudoniella acicularis]|uniref:Sodium/nucleoside cotransporter n=1 Tax=Cudoniella acicularis TaxID=354080 RepID=A0A8H4RM25_9HELO|nr:hypothetical protein G7Y89_g6530 [Cudoniella acicularis]